MFAMSQIKNSVLRTIVYVATQKKNAKANVI